MKNNEQNTKQQDKKQSQRAKKLTKLKRVANAMWWQNFNMI